MFCFLFFFLFVTGDLLEQCGTALCLQGLSENIRAILVE